MVVAEVRQNVGFVIVGRTEVIPEEDDTPTGWLLGYGIADLAIRVVAFELAVAAGVLFLPVAAAVVVDIGFVKGEVPFVSHSPDSSFGELPMF